MHAIFLVSPEPELFYSEGKESRIVLKKRHVMANREELPEKAGKASHRMMISGKWHYLV